MPDISRTLQQVVGNLNENGRIFIHLPCEDSFLYNFFALANYDVKKKYGGHIQKYKPLDLTSRLEEQGLEIGEEESIKKPKAWIFTNKKVPAYLAVPAES